MKPGISALFLIIHSVVILTATVSHAQNVKCSCSSVHDPMCGTNGRTYGNGCELECAQESNPRLRSAYRGYCPPDSVVDRSGEQCICSRSLHYEPVCGTDAKTYRNECQLRCQNRNARVLYIGECYYNRDGSLQRTHINMG